MSCKLTPEEVQELLTISREDPAALSDAIRLKMNPKWGGKVMEFWRAGLLSNPATHIANTASNALFQGLRAAEQAVSVGLQAGLSKMTRVERDRFTGELGASLAGARSIVPDALGRLKTEMVDALTAAPEIIDPKTLEEVGPGRVHVGAIGGKFGRAVRAPYRLLEAADRFMKDLSGEQELFRQAYRDGAQRGLSGEDLGRHVEGIVRQVHDEQNTSPAVEAIRKEMVNVRLEETFQTPLGPFMRKVASMSQSNPLAGIIAPFVRTPYNITAEALRRTPVVSAWKTLKAYREYKAGRGRLGDVTDEAARGVVGLAIMSGVAMLAESGAADPGQGGFGITGGGPTDFKKRENLQRTGWQPYSVRVGDRYVSYRRAAPLSQVVGIAADLREASDAPGKSNMLEKLFDAVTSNVLDQTFLSGVESFARAVHDPRRAGSTWVKSMESSLVPGAIRAAAATIDPVQRDAPAFETLHGIPAPIASGIPFLSEQLPEKRTATGEPAPRTSGGLNPFRTSTLEPGSDLEREFARIGYVPSQPSRKVTVPATGGAKTELTDEEFSALQDANVKASERARRLLRMPSYRAAPDTDDEAAGTGRQSKAKMLSSIFEAAHRETLAKLARGVRRRWSEERQQMASGTGAAQ
jgi:uncharacterized protein YjiS (DUF1127 family)